MEIRVRKEQNDLRPRTMNEKRKKKANITKNIPSYDSVDDTSPPSFPPSSPAPVSVEGAESGVSTNCRLLLILSTKIAFATASPLALASLSGSLSAGADPGLRPPRGLNNSADALGGGLRVASLTSSNLLRRFLFC
jgi:hypothetical protein